MRPKNKRPWLAGLLGACSIAAAGAAQAETGERLPDRQAQTWAAACATCHGTNGRAVPDGGMPALAGLNEDWLVQQMQDFAQGKRPATIMHQLAKGYDDDQIRRIARWLSQQTPQESP